jgi:MFS family permease
VENPPSDREDLLLDPKADPGGAALGASGAEATVNPRWPVLLRQRVARRAERSPRFRWWSLTALLAGLLSLNITFTVFVVALPTVRDDFHTNFSVLTWASTGPLLAFGLAAPFFGKAGDLFGHRRLYLFGLGGAMVSAIVTATAPDVGVLLVGRALDGVQGAATGTASMALILQLFDREERVKALGWWTLVGAGGPVLGVTLGSPVIQYLGWRDLFWGQLMLLVVAALVVALLLPARAVGQARGETGERGAGGGAYEVQDVRPAVARQAENAWEGMDWVGSWSLAGTVTAAMLVLSIGPIDGWESAGVILCAAAAALLAGLFVWRELTFATPLIPTRYWRRRNFMFPLGMQGFSSFAYFGGFFLFPLLMEQVYGYSVSEVGFVSVARPLLFAISSPIAGYMAVRTGERFATVVGAIAVLGSMLVFATLGPSSGLGIMVLALALSGLGMGVALPSTSSTMANEVAASEYGVMSAAQLMVTQVGEVAGIQVVLTLQESLARHAGLEDVHHSTRLLPSFQIGFWVAAFVAAAGVACATFMRPLARGAGAAGRAGGGGMRGAGGAEGAGGDGAGGAGGKEGAEGAGGADGARGGAVERVWPAEARG